MSRLLALSLVLSLATITLAKDNAPLGPPVATLEQVQKEPSDAKIFGRFANGHVREISRLTDENPDAAEEKLGQFAATLNKLELTGDAKIALERSKLSLKMYRERIELARLTMADVEKALLESPDDADALRRWLGKVREELIDLAYAQAPVAEPRLAAAKAFAAKIAEQAKEEATKKRIADYSGERGIFTSIGKAIAENRELGGLVGKDAAPLNIQTWVNGRPVTGAELKGKVVLLDFWAVWCGPCVATFPHLREWNHQYADKGLVMIGLTTFYNCKWDDDAGYYVKVDEEKDGKVPVEQELAMLEKFADYYHLEHRFAVREKDDKELTEYYQENGIPHVVVIDQQGKIRMIRVGSSKRNSEDIGKLLAELLK